VAHPRLTTQINDQRCFGCHSRSARVSLNYRGLAEVGASAWQNAGASSLLRLDDLRLVERKESDLHHRAGLGCSLFAALSPHTTGKARDCVSSCHGFSRALGLGAGQLLHCADGRRFEPERPALQDGLPADAWTALSGASVGESIRIGDRSLGRQEILRVLDAELTPEAPSDKTARSRDGADYRRSP